MPFSPCTSILECKIKCNFLNIKMRGTKTFKKSQFPPQKGTRTAMKPKLESELFFYSFLSSDLPFSVKRYFCFGCLGLSGYNGST